MREAFRPYVKAITLSNQNKLAVSLTDSAGTLIDCNYIQVESVSGVSTEGNFVVVPTGISTSILAGTVPAANSIAVIDGQLSGVAASTANIATGSVVISLPYNDLSKAMWLSQSDDGPNTYAITYGNVRVTNSLADNKLPTGN
tara:strand:+ start:487 stop:915 length:429 start_codon:yes stop_codon:yes gene_type:complete